MVLIANVSGRAVVGDRSTHAERIKGRLTHRVTVTVSRVMSGAEIFRE